MTRDMVPLYPVHTSMQSEEFYESLDPGIRFAVRLLHSEGIPTTQSCEGSPGHSYLHPSIDMGESRAFEAVATLMRYGIRVHDVSRIWHLDANGLPDENLWRVTLVKDVLDRADEYPQFIFGGLHRDCWYEESIENEVKVSMVGPDENWGP